MIRPFDGASPAALAPLVYNGYTLNSVTSTESGEIGTRVFGVASKTAIDYISENRQWAEGIEVYGITKLSRIIQLSCGMHAASVGGLMDGIKALCNAFDPDDIAYNNDDPFLPLTFTSPLTTPEASKYFALPIAMPEPVLSNSNQGFGCRFSIPLLLKDPRRYLQTPITQTNNGTLTNTGDYRSYPTITFTMSGAGSGSFTASNTATRQGAKSVVFDLSSRSNLQAITLDFQNRRVLVDGTATQGIFVSGDWFDIEPGANALAYTNTANAGSRTCTVYPAFSY